MTTVKPRVLIATPTPGSVKTAYMKTVLATMVHLTQNGIDCSWDHEDGSDIALQRNLLATRFFCDRSLTHVFCLDSDIAVAGETCARLLSANLPVVGAIYPSRCFDFSLVERALQWGHTPKEAQLFGFDWLSIFEDGADQVTVRNSMMEVQSIGFGAVLIQRSVFETMISQKAATKRLSPTKGEYFGFFSPRLADVADDKHYFEDVSFCRRWRIDCGGTIWAMTDIPIYHIGDYGFGGSYQEYIEAVHRMAQKNKVSP
jgi:hypothetical protein